MPAEPETTQGVPDAQQAKRERRHRLTGAFVDQVTPLLEQGVPYSDISVERLITMVGLSRSTFYSYFADKAALLEAMAHDVTDDLVQAASRWLQAGVPGSRAELQEALVPLFETYRRHQAILRSVTDAAAYDPRIRALHASLVGQTARVLRDHVAALGRGLDPATTSWWLVWMLERGLYQMVSDDGSQEAEDRLDGLVDLLWRLLYA